MRRHLPSAARQVCRRAHSLQHHFIWSNPKRQAQRAIAIVRKEPVVPRPQRQSRRHLQRLMTRGRNLEIDPLLTLQKNFAVIHVARKIHQPVDFHQLLCS